MKTIKFRAKATQEYQTSIDGVEEGQWVYGYYYFCRKRMSGIIVTTLEAECGGVGSGIVQVEIEVDNKTVGQFIGLSDKNKKEIYKGDIIVVLGDVNMEVYYTELSASFKAKNSKGISTLSNFEEIEVVGNIYENPELLKN